MTKTRLGVNIDHVATIRNARGEIYPEPLKAALLAQKSGADSITIHLREDRRHIRDRDLKNYRNLISELKLKEYKFRIIRHRKKDALLRRIFKNLKRN